jgi:3-hydroxyacyl-[acyl-carrier-protein] dehydratase
VGILDPLNDWMRVFPSFVGDSREIVWQVIQILDQLHAMCYRTISIDRVTKAQLVDGTITARVRVPADSVWFDGHFPGAALLPGVAQLAIVTAVLEEALGTRVRVTEVSRVRFKLAIMPAQTMEVQITSKESDPWTYRFRLLKGQDLACSGFLKVAA